MRGLLALVAFFMLALPAPGAAQPPKPLFAPSDPIPIGNKAPL